MYMAVIFGVVGLNKLMSEAGLAFMRHALSKYYRDGTRIATKGVNINWQHTYRDTLAAYRDAVLRYAHGMRRLHANREYTNLTAVVPERDRLRFRQLIGISQTGKGSITPAFQSRIDAAERAAPRAH